MVLMVMMTMMNIEEDVTPQKANGHDDDDQLTKSPLCLRALLIPHLPALAALLCPACPPHDPLTIILDPDLVDHAALTEALKTLYTTGDATALAQEIGLQDPPERLGQDHQEEALDDIPETVKEEKGGNERGKPCKDCNVTFALESSLRKHQKICALGSRPRWECSICAERFQFRRMLRSHEKDKHTGKPTAKLRSKPEHDIQINDVKTEENVSDFLFVEDGNGSSGHEEMQVLPNEADYTSNDNTNLPPGPELADMEFTPAPAVQSNMVIAGSRVGESEIGIQDTGDVEEQPDVTTLLEQWRTKVMQG